VGQNSVVGSAYTATVLGLQPVKRKELEVLRKTAYYFKCYKNWIDTLLILGFRYAGTLSVFSFFLMHVLV
jgi:hypothetical protein